MANTVSVGVKELYVFELDTDCTILDGGKGYRTCKLLSATPFELTQEDGTDFTAQNMVGGTCGPTMKNPSRITGGTGSMVFCDECPSILSFLLGWDLATFDANPTEGIGFSIKFGNTSCGTEDLVDPVKATLLFVEKYFDGNSGICNPTFLGAKVSLIGAANNFKLNNAKSFDEGGSAFRPEIMFDINANPAFATPGNEPADIFTGISGAWDVETGIYEGFIDPAGYATLQTLVTDCDGFATPAIVA